MSWGGMGTQKSAGQTPKGVVGGCTPRASHLSPLLGAKRCFPSEQLRVSAHTHTYMIYKYIYIYYKYISVNLRLCACHLRRVPRIIILYYYTRVLYTRDWIMLCRKPDAAKYLISGSGRCALCVIRCVRRCCGHLSRRPPHSRCIIL